MAARVTSRVAAGARDALAALLIGLVRVYQWTLSPITGARCRFDPTCSHYAVIAIRRFGPWRGGRLTLRRLVRCHPWGASGYDPVPEDLGKDSPA